METTCQKVTVTSKVSQEAWFVMHPRHRTVGAGDLIRYGDSVCIESPKIQGALLHCSRQTTRDGQGRGTGKECYEVNANTERTTWKLKLFKNSHRGEGCPDVCGGDVLRLRWRLCALDLVCVVCGLPCVT